MVVSTEEHAKFVKCLEKYGMILEGDVWSQISADMKWSIEDVKVYAYWYMQHLHEINEIENNNKDGNETSSLDTVDKKEKRMKRKENGGGEDIFNEGDWTFDESILFNTLTVLYGTSTHHRWEKISSFIPNKVAEQCEGRWKS